MAKFTELPTHKRTHRLSIVAVWNPIDVQCENTGCKQEEDIEEIVECPVCGRWICEECFEGHAMAKEVDYSTLSTRPYCSNCSKLTSDERAVVMDLRAKLGGAL